MTDGERNEEGAEEALEDLEAPAESAADVAGGICPQATGVCRPTNRCSPVNTMIHCSPPTQLCPTGYTCELTQVAEQQ
ncbi:MAG TPA: hypothetical protein VHX66_10120 [Solirubrobacteraceae bacterium]|jgi:hypothetical protein|nr:hypothetical protein [Solirubrobacteraceae bacterium]